MAHHPRNSTWQRWPPNPTTSILQRLPSSAPHSSMPGKATAGGGVSQGALLSKPCQHGALDKRLRHGASGVRTIYVSLRANRAAHNVVTRKPRSACQHGTRARIFKRYGALAAEQSNHISALHRHSADRTLVALCGAVHATHHMSAGRKGGADGAAAADGASVRKLE